ncbi:MAG: BamA/TamA family outer membrane protein [Pseudomonadota bacterium]|nr:BamA/TamA family outer membrane protein [Pseudomonadota bacterium]
MAVKLFLKKIKQLRYALMVTLMLCAFHAQAIPFIGEKYDVSIEATDHPELQKELASFIKKQQSSNEQLKQIDNISQYQKLLSAILQKKMKSIGYYDFGISPTSDGSDIAFLIQPGQRAMIESIKVKQPEFIFEDLSAPLAKLGLSVGEPLIAENVLAGEQALIDYINKKYCFVKPQLDKTITLDTFTKKAQIVFTLDTESGKTIRNINFEGNTSIDDEFLKNIAQVEKSCYKTRKIIRAQNYLLQSGLLTSATPELITDEDSVDVTFHVNERKHRTQSLGIGYSPEEQLRFSAGWENRNWRGNGKKLTTDFQISQISTQLDGSLRVPQFKDPDLDLVFEAEVSETKVEAFDSVSAAASAVLEYQFNRNWLGSIGIASEYSQVESSTQDDIFRLLSFPASIQRDTSRSLLDPVQGSIWSLSIEPFTDMVDKSIQFTQFASSIRTYSSPEIWGLNDKETKDLTIATRVALGTITGEPLNSVPADQRYYVGGGGSVRGFDYQSLSPRQDGEIAGGLSFVEIAAELRFRLSQSWGGSLFVDSGAGFAEQTPDFSEQLSIGGGFGVRYITSFAPIRIDLAWPLSSPYEFENKVQLYVGLKQAF